MAQCPNCKAAIWIGQRYCSTCDSYLPNPEEEAHFCPQCGTRVAPQQELCHKCNLLEMAGASLQTMTRGRRCHPWVPGVFIGTGLVIVVLLLISLTKKSSGPPLPIGPPPAPPAAGQTPATSPPRLESAPSAPTAPAVKELSGPSAPEPLSPPALKTPVPSMPIYFVKARALALRDGPTVSATQIATLDFNDKVELLETSGGWGRIREVQRDIVGWSYTRYLEPVKADQQ
jgi:hypothetical protein